MNVLLWMAKKSYLRIVWQAVSLKLDLIVLRFLCLHFQREHISFSPLLCSQRSSFFSRFPSFSLLFPEYFFCFCLLQYFCQAGLWWRSFLGQIHLPVFIKCLVLPGSLRSQLSQLLACTVLWETRSNEAGITTFDFCEPSWEFSNYLMDWIGDTHYSR